MSLWSALQRDLQAYGIYVNLPHVFFWGGYVQQMNHAFRLAVANHGMEIVFMFRVYLYLL